MKIHILGSSFTLQSDEDEEYLKRVAEYYEKKLEEIRKKVSTDDPVKLAILTGMLITDDLFSAEKTEVPIKDLEEAEKITLNLIDTIARTLAESAIDNPEE